MSNYKKVIFVSLALCFGQGFIRVATAGNSDHLYMPWNIFLALVPLLFALKFKDNRGMRLWIFAVLWLLFLPNSFYVVTDLIHLNSVQVLRENIRGPFVSYDNVGSLSIVYDALYLFTCAAVSFIYGLESIRLFKNRFSSIIKKSNLTAVLGIIFLLCGLAIYLGRFIRLNSWDILVKPWGIVTDTLDLFIKPANHTSEWIVVASFSLVIGITYYLYQISLEAIKNSRE